jgi:hypothetical protein
VRELAATGSEAPEGAERAQAARVRAGWAQAAPGSAALVRAREWGPGLAWAPERVPEMETGSARELD